MSARESLFAFLRRLWHWRRNRCLASEHARWFDETYGTEENYEEWHV